MTHEQYLSEHLSLEDMFEDVLRLERARQLQKIYGLGFGKLFYLSCYQCDLLEYKYFPNQGPEWAYDDAHLVKMLNFHYFSPEEFKCLYDAHHLMEEAALNHAKKEAEIQSHILHQEELDRQYEEEELKREPPLLLRSDAMDSTA